MCVLYVILNVIIITTINTKIVTKHILGGAMVHFVTSHREDSGSETAPTGSPLPVCVSSQRHTDELL